jgi:TRAP-type C4-dicarboxylate transport system substrate-binding protein
MNLKKVSILIIILLISVFVISACGGNSESEGETGTEVIKLKLATQATPEQPWHDRIMEFVDTIESETDGAIDITVYPADQLGDYYLCFEEVMKGNIDINVNSLPSTYDKRIDALYMLYLVSDYEEAREIYSKDKYIYKMVDEICAERNVKLLGFECMGFGGLGLTKLPENWDTPGADKDLLLRVSSSEVARIWAQEMGYSPVSVTYSDLYSSLQTGVVEGWIGGQPYLNYTSFRDVIKVFIKDNNFVEMSTISINSDTWGKLTPEQQEIVQNAADQMWEKSLQDAERDDFMYTEKLEEEGIEVVIPSKEKLQEFAEFTRENVWPVAEESLGKEVMQELYSMYE